MKNTLFFVLALAFGFVLSRSGAADYNFIQDMFLFRDVQLYGIIGTAVMVVAPGLWLLRRHGKTVGGAPMTIPEKPLHGGNVIGGVMFGIGWSMTGMCPGPILVNVGEGKLYALAAFAGTLLGAYLFGVSYPKLAPRFGLPALRRTPTPDPDP